MAPKRPFVVDPVLTAIAIGYSNPAHTLIADQVLPRMTVGQETFKWTEYPLAEAFTVPDTRVGRRGQVNQVEFNGEERESSVEDFGLDTPVPYTDIRAAAAARAQKRSTYDPEQHSTMTMTKLVELDREIRVANKIHNANAYAADRKVQLSGTSQFNDYTNSDPIGVLDTAIHGTLIHRANTLVMGFPVWSVIKRHPMLINAVKGGLTTEGMITRQQLADLLEIKEVLVGEAFYNTSKPGQAVTMARAWGKHVSALFIDKSAGPDEITFGFTAQFGEKIAGRIEDEDIGLEGGFRIRSGERVKELIVAQDVGYFVEDAVL